MSKDFFTIFIYFSNSAFAQLGVITRTSKKFAEIAVAERYLIQGIRCVDIIPCLIITQVKNKELKKQPLRITFL